MASKPPKQTQKSMAAPSDRKAKTKPNRAARPKRTDPNQRKLSDWLRDQSKEELVARVLHGSQLSTTVREDLLTAYRLARGQRSETVVAAKREIADLTSEDVWYDDWRDCGQTPDYSGLERRFRALSKAGMHDELLDLGRLLLEKGTELIGTLHNDGSTDTEIAHCLSIAFASLTRSERPLASRLLMALDLLNSDDYGILPDQVDKFVNGRHRQAVWSEVADHLLAKLGTSGDKRAGGVPYRRSQQIEQIVFALDGCKRQSEATDLLRSEVSVTQDHVRLVDRLMVIGDSKAALAAALEGLRNADDTGFGQRSQLRDLIRDLAVQRGDHPLAAAYRADDFYRQPSRDTFFDLLKAAKKARCEDLVRSWLKHFLETGRCPSARAFKRRKGEPEAWPLPKTGEKVSTDWSQGMGLRLLRDIAIQESKPTLALHFHDRLQSIRANQPTAMANHDDEELADAIVASHPRRAIEIYLTNAQRLIAQTNTRLYPQAVSLLGKIRLLLLPKKTAEWNKLLNQLRSDHARKSNFLRELDLLNRSRGSSTRSRRRRSRTRNARPS